MELRHLRRKINLNQTQLSNKLGVHLRTIQNWESGKTQISDKVLPKLAELFKVTMEEILKLKYDFSTPIMEEEKTDYKRINEFSNLKRKDLEVLLKTERQMLVKVESGIKKLLNNGNDIESLSILDQYKDMKKKILKTIADIEVNL